MTEESTDTAQRRRDIEFLSLMVHDLRQPLTVVLGMAVSLDTSREQMSDQRKRAYVSNIVRGGKWMKTLVDDVLIAGGEVGSTASRHAVSFSLPALIEETIGDLAPQDVERVEHRPAIDLPPAYGDPVMQRQVLQNLLDNALKYSGRGTPIHVGVVERDSMLVVTVADRGLGIAPSDVPTIFDQHTRVMDPNQVSDIEGSGMGLFICRLMVHAQGGEIDFDPNTHGVGSVFTYTIPRAPIAS